MSRIGKQPIELPDGVKVAISGSMVTIEGPKGKLEREIRQEISIEQQDKTLVLARNEETQAARAFHGLERSLISNMVTGVSQGFSKELELIGVGYRADMKGTVLNLGLGYSHDINYQLPEGIKGSVLKEGRDVFVKLEGVDKQLVGQTAAKIRGLRPPEPYKGKGVRYRGEQVRRKAGKAGKAAA